MHLTRRIQDLFVNPTGAVVALVVFTASACADEAPRPSIMVVSRVTADAGASVHEDSGTPAPPAGAACVPARSSETIPARTVATSTEVHSGGDRLIYVSQLFNLFSAQCGSCHAGQAKLGNFNIQAESKFRDAANPKMLERMLSDDPAKVMPPPPYGVAASERKVGDPVTQLAQWVGLYLDQKSPIDAFTVPASTMGPAPDTHPYALTVEAGNNMTNLGSCIPAAALVGRSASKMAELDAFFAGLQKGAPGVGSAAERIGLPESLTDTDLFTFDTEELARHRVIGYAPEYPLWSDSARKLRQVRVPLGQSIRFDRDLQTFDIPENTRFYKTFLKPLRQLDGAVRWRKVETRLIVARHDVINADSSATPSAIFGTYEWNDDETEAKLLTTPQRNFEPFADHTFPIVTDEIVEQQVMATNPRKPSASLLKAQAMRTYAVPSLTRCVQCHMGSPTGDFVLGFFPLQLNRHALGEEGAIEPSGPDELNQLQRLIDYGVITGMSSPDDVVRLSASQGTRLPRNRHELEAQGYLLGNCAHCHNPRGFTTVNNPILADRLDFLPSAKGGIFQFDLQTTSPRIARADQPIPYITPSLFDFSDSSYPKAFPDATPNGGPATTAVLAPWRSLVYRNVDTPFTYVDGGTLYPHMPMNVPGFDCRAPRLLGDWMVSIPSRRKSPELFENWVCGTANCNGVDQAPQPYEEVRPGEADYGRAVAAANDRLEQYHGGVAYVRDLDGHAITSEMSRFNYCANTSDILDPDVTGLSPTERTPKPGAVLNADGTTALPAIGVPLRPHWFSTDITDPPPPWAARRSDWASALGLPHDPGLEPPLTDEKHPTWLSAKAAAEMLVPTTGAPLSLTSELRDFALTRLPMGLWDERAVPCPSAASSVRTVGSLPVSQRPSWIARADPMKNPILPGDHLYEQVPGQAIYGMICINCHGERFDSRGRMADNLMNMTGGLARVANFRDGLFGDLGGTRESTFGALASTTPANTADDWTARYVAWMGLGGTQAGIPLAILQLLKNTPVVGRSRAHAPDIDTANMLEVARALCLDVLPGDAGAQFDPSSGWLSAQQGSYKQSLIRDNGDAELWMRLCSQGNPAPVRVVSAQGDLWQVTALYTAASFPPAARVGDFSGAIQASLRKDNLFPWCMDNTPGSKAKAVKDAVKTPAVFCPSGLPRATEDDKRTWAVRGAINAGFLVFLYLDAVSKGLLEPVPPYNHCDLAH